MALGSSDTLVRKGLPIWYFWMSFVAIVEIGIAGYLTGKGDNNGTYGMEIRNRVRFALFTGLWTFLFGIIVGAGTLRRIRFINTGFVHFIYTFITLVFWIAVGASLEKAIDGSAYPHRTTLRACEWIGWIEAIFTAITVPWILLGVAHAKGGIRGEVAV